MKKTILSSILALSFTGLNAQPQPVLPQLVVMLTVDQLRTDYLEAFSALYGEKGLKRLLRDGRVFRQAHYPFSRIDRASAIAALYSGSTPAVNGIVGENWLDAATLRPVNCVDDPQYMGNYTDESSSPAKLLTSTIGDELKIATRNRALVYAISPFRDAAILSAGHAGTGAFWLNERTGKWCSTTYYNEFPWWLSQYNDRQAVDLRIKDMVWEPLFPIERYRYLPEWRDIAFKYKLEGYRENKYVRFNAGPLANDEVNRITEELLSKSTVGHDSIPDLLSLTYYAGNYNHQPTVECAMEIQDAYARLDRQIAALLDILDKKVGLKRVLFCLASTGYTEPEAPDAALYRIPGGEFHMNRCTTLLNMFLMATYGEGRYVEAYYDNEIYLNHKLIENKQLNLTEIQERAADFLAQFSGVGSVYTAHRLMLGAWSPRQELARNAYHPKHSGDLQINVLPGWTIVKENGGSNRVVRSAHIPTPLILMGGGIRPEIVRTPVDILRVAPTLAGAIHIRAPNACDVAPID